MKNPSKRGFAVFAYYTYCILYHIINGYLCQRTIFCHVISLYNFNIFILRNKNISLIRFCAFAVSTNFKTYKAIIYITELYELHHQLFL